MTTEAKSTDLNSPLTLVAAVAPLAKIDDIRLSGSSIDEREHFSDPPVAVEHLFKTSHSVSDNKLVISVDFHFAADTVKPVSSDRPLLRIDASFTVEYSFKADEMPTDEQLSAFARINSVYNAWPYWREYLQSTMARLRVPQFTLPLLTLKAILKAYDQTDASDSDASPA